jgi:hypothetical protein
MKFKELHFDRTLRFSIGIEEESNSYYFSIPVSNSFVDYEEYYKITKSSFDLFIKNNLEANKFAEECRQRIHDSLLFFAPGSDRGQAS